MSVRTSQPLKGSVRMLRVALRDVVIQQLLGVNPTPECIESNTFRIENKLDSIFVGEENPSKETFPKMVRSISESSEEHYCCKRARMNHSD
jgi:hypothetical protein